MKKYETPKINITEIGNVEVIMTSTLADNISSGVQDIKDELTIDF